MTNQETKFKGYFTIVKAKKKKNPPIIECDQKLYLTTSKCCFIDLNVNVSWVHLQLDFNMLK